MEVPDARERQSLLSNDKPPPRDIEQVSLEEDGLLPEQQSPDLDPSTDENGSTDPLEQNKQKLNTLFGFRPFGYHVSKKPNRPVADTGEKDYSGGFNWGVVGNYLWIPLFGWWISAIFLIASGLLWATYVGRSYGRLCWKLCRYFIWPFGKFVIEKVRVGNDASITFRSGWADRPIVPYCIWLFVYVVVVLPVLGFGYLMTWFWVFSIPMAKVTFEIIKILFTKPWAISITTDYNKARSHSVLLCTHQAFNTSYFKHNVWGMNIVFFNLFPVVAVRVVLILVTMIGDFQHLMPDMVQFALDLVCAIPITFYIGLAISSIAAQTNYMIGALLNASFGSITELTLYTLAIRRGSLDALILYSVTGGLLSDMLLLPGMSMIFGGIKYKEQKFNPVAAGVGSILLFIAIVGAFTPTIFYHAFGVTKESCNDCVINFNQINGTVGDLVCNGCRFVQNDLLNDPLFMEGARYLQYFSAAVLPLAYIVGMVFTFKTHSHIFTEEESEHGGGEHEGSPEWPIWSSVILMLVSIAMFGLIAEDIVHVVEGVLKTLGVTQSFLGLTLIALTPAATELASAIKFALAGQINLSVEIGSASAIQISLIQMPALTAISTIFGATGKNGEPFNLIFPLLAVFGVMLAVITFNYISSEGKTNYFVGASMVIIYLILVASFYFVPEDPEGGSGHGGGGGNSTIPIAAPVGGH